MDKQRLNYLIDAVVENAMLTVQSSEWGGQAGARKGLDFAREQLRQEIEQQRALLQEIYDTKSYKREDGNSVVTNLDLVRRIRAALGMHSADN